MPEFDGPHRLKVDAEPSGMHVFFTVLRVDMKADNARLAGEAKTLFFPVGDLQPLCIGKMLARRVPGLRMEKRQRAFGVRLRYLLQQGEGLHRIGAEGFQTARFEQLGNFALLSGHQIPGKSSAVAM